MTNHTTTRIITLAELRRAVAAKGIDLDPRHDDADIRHAVRFDGWVG